MVQILHFRFHSISIFLLTFIKIYQEFELLSITYIIMLYWKKDRKICRQKQDQHSPRPKSILYFLQKQEEIIGFWEHFIWSKYMFWLSYEWFSIWCDILLLKIVILKSFKCKFFALFPVWLLPHLDCHGISTF